MTTAHTRDSRRPVCGALVGILAVTLTALAHAQGGPGAGVYDCDPNNPNCLGTTISNACCCPIAAGSATWECAKIPNIQWTCPQWQRWAPADTRQCTH